MKAQGKDRTGAGTVVDVDRRKRRALVKLFGHRGARGSGKVGDVWVPMDGLTVRKSKRGAV